MDIGPVQRRLTAEPINSPVPAAPEPVHEPSALERMPSDGEPAPPAPDAATHA